MHPQISTIIPTYNSAATLRETLDSVADQTLTCTHQIIVVDDGSTDRTCEIAEGHRSSPLVIRQDNQGAATALNTGIERATGSHLAFIEHDDLWAPDKLALQYNLLCHGDGPDFVFGYSESFRCPSLSPDAFRSLSYRGGIVPGFYVGTLFGRRETILSKVGLFDPSLRAGFFLDWMRRAREARARYDMVGSVIHRRRIRPNTLSRRRAARAPFPQDEITRDFLEVARRAIAEKRRVGELGMTQASP